MPTPSKKLAEALEKMRDAQVDGIVRSEALTRTYLTRLTKAGFLQEIIRGWYYVSHPSMPSGSTAWYGHYWTFLKQYLNDRFGEDYCLLPESSLYLLTGATVVPKQLSIMRRSPGQQVIVLCSDTSLFIYQERGRFPNRTVEWNGIRLMELSEALMRVPESYFRNRADDAVIALQMLQDPTNLLADLLEDGHSVIAGRLAGAFRHIGDTTTADRILKTMQSAGYDVRESDPFNQPMPSASSAVRSPSPYVARLKGMWPSMRADIEEVFPVTSRHVADLQGYLAQLEERYAQDAYHSLSIEGYQVTPALIEKIREGRWDPAADPSDRDTMNALAARGYWEAFVAVKASIASILDEKDPAAIVREAHHDWHRALFASAVQSGLLPPSALAGYRRGPVFIRGSRHVPLPDHALADAMAAYFDLLAQESHPAVRAVLGHFLFVFIHPYSDGNGRMGRFIMNAMFASGGYPWTIVHVEHRAQYMEALEEASVNGNIRPFASFILAEMNAT